MSSRDDPPTRRKTDFEIKPIEPRIRVLAVDDDPAYLRYVKLVLTRAGFEVEVARDGQAAIDHLRRDGQFDLLLIDLAMPGMDGIETVRRIQIEGRLPHLYSILLTAREGTETKLRALNSGLDDFLSKKAPDSEIVAKIRSAARRLDLERRLHLQNEELQMLALTDELTGIANRRALFRAGDEILASGRRMTVVLFDLDRFKHINDTFGHLAGDRILADVAATFKGNTRYGDVIARYGGDEFVLLLPDTEVEEGRQISERLLEKIRQLTWTISGAVLSVNAQCGVAASTAQTSLPELLSVCDQALYRRKHRAAHPRDGAKPEEAV